VRRLQVCLLLASLAGACVWDVPPHPDCESRCTLSDDGNRQRCGFCTDGSPINCDGFWRRTAGEPCPAEAACGEVDLGLGEIEVQCLSDALCDPGETGCRADGGAALVCVQRPDGSSAFAHHACAEGRTCGEGLGRCDF
jgi:hypothetical protein